MCFLDHLLFYDKNWCTPAQDMNVCKHAVVEAAEKFGCRPAPTINERIGILFNDECYVQIFA